MHIDVDRTASLGDSSYLLTHDGHGVVVDPQLHLAPLLDLIEKSGATVTHVLDTHVHNDYLSGAKALAAQLDADLVLPAGAGTRFTFVPAFHSEPLAAGQNLSILPLHTPGHTPEHTSYLIGPPGEPGALFSGGSLLLGAAGRTDLLGSELAESLARLQYGSVRRLAGLPHDTGLYPTHGAGSFCAAGTSATGNTTIGAEIASNPVLAYADEDSFVQGQLANLLPYPDYYPAMAPINRIGREAIVDPSPAVVDGPSLLELRTQGVEIIDGRSRHHYAQGHVRDSLNIELSDSFAPWVGWLVPFGTPIALVLDVAQSAVAASLELARIGYQVTAVAYDLAGIELVTNKTAGPAELSEAIGTKNVIDVRDPQEHRSSRVKGIVHRYVPDLRHDLALEPGEVWLTCASGFRASVAAGLVERQGFRPVVVASGGIPELLKLRPDLAN